ncbi:DUF1223 domain-containing protein [Mesobaculum littorinae]|uniref:DUF1223 domain-containing protein n=1 Tax=Mesobaculum littorinae TaxID=2486419 RepID=A0A438AKD7_9RHOB|nr:DUF1223 domain-containing protein [Mesobaculum littorinae]
MVIELFTSQGCSSCPPADALLADLADRPEVLPLALHVDYWDYIGWKDRFASPAFTHRQKGYAHAAGVGTVYTPQMVVGGVDHVVGYRPSELIDLIEKHRAAPDRVSLTATLANGTVTVEAPAAPDLGAPVMVQLVTFLPEETTEIERGENAGKTLTYTNIVQDWRDIGEWSGAEPLKIDAPLDGGLPAAVILQRTGVGAVLGAARVQ